MNDIPVQVIKENKDIALQYIHSYLKRTKITKQRTKINFSYSAFADILFGVPQGSILGTLLLNIYICDLFFENSDTDVSDYAYDNPLYACSSDLDSFLNFRKHRKNFWMVS